MPPKDQKKSRLPARLFRRGALSCPNCKALFEGHVDSCSRCGFHLGLLDQQMPGPAPAFTPLMDFTGLAEGSRKQIEAHVTRIKKTFPQVNPAICFVNCPEKIPPHMLACWILNHAPICEEEDPTWRALLLIDPQRGEHSFSSGFQLETFLAREEIENLMNHASQAFYLQEWHTGALEFLDGLFNLLRSSCEIAQKTDREARRLIMK